MNIYTVNIIVGLAAIIVGYLFGAIPTGVIIGVVFFKKDPRDFYSHNSGGTNTGRVLGKKIGILVTILDMLKAIIPVYTLWAILVFSPLKNYMDWNGYDAAPLWYWLCGLFTAIGHCWPIYIGFRGGKAVSCFMGLNTLTSWIEFLLGGGTYLVVLKKTKTVSISSMSAGIVSTVVGWAIAIIVMTTPFDGNILMWSCGQVPWLKFGLEFAVMNTIVSAILIFRHRSNIQRIKAGTENKIS